MDKQDKKPQSQYQQGSVLILTLLVLTTFLILGTAAFQLSYADSKIANVQIQRQQAQLAAESALDEAMAHLYEKLQANINYDPTGQPEMTQQVSVWNSQYQYTVSKALEEPFNFDIIVKPAKSDKGQFGKQLAVQVHANTVPLGLTGDTTQPPASFRQAVFVRGNLAVTGDAAINGPIYVQEEPLTGQAGDFQAQGSAYISGGPVMATGSVSFQRPWNKDMDLVITEASAPLPTPVINDAAIQEQADYVYTANQSLDVTQLNDGEIVYVDGSITNLYGDLGSKTLLICASKDINLNSGLNQNFDGLVAVVAGNKVTFAGNDTIRGIIYAGGGLKITGTQKEHQDKVVGAIVCNGGELSTGNAHLAYDNAVVEQLFSRWSFAGECDGPPAYQVKSVDILRWEELN